MTVRVVSSVLRTQSLPCYLSAHVICAVIKVKHWYPGHITQRSCTVLLLSPASMLLKTVRLNVSVAVSACLCVTVNVFMLCVILSHVKTTTFHTNIPHTYSDLLSTTTC